MAKIIILSGAGISAESGISTFRDEDGLWENHKIEDICVSGCLDFNKDNTIKFYDMLRVNLKDKKPNYAHEVVAKLKNKYPDDIAVITQNVDNLFEKAGLDHNDVIHLHGYLTNVECEECRLVYDIGYSKCSEAFNGKCPDCYSKKVRPFIVMFGEKAPNYRVLNDKIKDCELLIVIGTSGNVIDVSFIAKLIPNSILNNLEKSVAIDESLFTKVYYDKATKAIDNIEKDIISYITNKKLF